MADTYGKSSREDNADETVKCWHISFKVEDSGKTNSFVVVVLAEEMSDPSDKAEAKTLANAKASTIKSAWTDTFATATTHTDEPTISGVVSL